MNNKSLGNKGTLRTEQKVIMHMVMTTDDDFFSLIILAEIR